MMLVLRVGGRVSGAEGLVGYPTGISTLQDWGSWELGEEVCAA